MLFSQNLIDSFPLLESQLLTLPLWYWLSIILALCLSLLIARFIKIPFSLLLAFFLRQKNGDKDLFIEKLKLPIYFFISVFIFIIISSYIKSPISGDNPKNITIKIAIFLSITHLLYRLIDWIFDKYN